MRSQWTAWRSGTFIPVGLGIVIGSCLGWLAITGIEWDLVENYVKSTSPQWLIGALLVLAIGFYLRALRWKVLFVTENITTGRLLLVQCAGAGANTFAPIRLLSEPVQFGILTLRDNLRSGSVVATMGVERILDLSSNVLIIGSCLAITSSPESFSASLSVTAAFCVIGIVLLLGVGFLGARWRKVRKLPFLAAFGPALEALNSQRTQVTWSFGLTLIYWILVGLTGWMIARALDMNVTFPSILMVVLVAFIFGTLAPGLPIVSGTFHFASVTLLGFWGVDREIAISYAMLHHLVLFLPPTLVAVIALPREGLASVGKIRLLFKDWQAHRHPSDTRKGIS